MRPRQLASQVLLIQIAIVAAAVLASASISFWLVSGQVTDEYEKRSLAIGHSVAAMPDVVEAFADPQPARAIQPIAEAIRKAEAASFVVVANVDGIRYSHPNPDQIGQRVSTDPSPALQGQAWVGIEQGTLGRSVRAKVPIFDGTGQVIGIVSVGFLEDQVNATLWQSMPLIAANIALALGLGIAGSVLLSRRLGRQTFGLQPSDILGLLEQRESMLHGIREGLLATDRDGRITLVNDEA
ncbi:MAG: sensor histidine kinase, partial [Chloroflexi bacterium]